MIPLDREQWSTLGPLLDRALDLSAAEQATLIAELETSSPALAASLASLLSVEEIADRRGFLAEARPIGLAGLELGHYTLVRPLGQGGMGSVWLGRRTDGRY